MSLSRSVGEQRYSPMSDPYTEVNSIWARTLAGDREQTARDVIAVLTHEGIRLRQTDGTLVGVTLSKPTSDPESRVVGLRYIKQDTMQTEDHFTLRPGGAIEKHYRGTLEKQWPEYRGTHKLRVDITLYEGDRQVLPTRTNTITLPPRP
jgi:hypothetical protein